MSHEQIVDEQTRLTAETALGGDPVVAAVNQVAETMGTDRDPVGRVVPAHAAQPAGMAAVKLALQTSMDRRW